MERGHVTRYYYDIHGRKVSTQDALGRVTKSTYDKLGQVLETGQFGVVNGIADTYRQTNQYQYDELGNRYQTKNALGGLMRYRFDAMGNVIYSQDEMNRVKQFKFNKSGEQTQESYFNVDGQGTSGTITKSYNEFGQLTNSNDLSNKKQFGFLRQKL